MSVRIRCANLFSKLFRSRSSYHDFEAVKDVSFDVPHGQAVGIIGRNGSGKSTLLKIVAGVYRPTKGTVTVNGTLAPLIELGAGFHHELTGRENILLNGLLMGYSKREMLERQQAIIDFADIGEFIDAPVKQYSSGMYMRLAFAVAIEVDPQVLVLDEILAVGDMGFQAKCFERIRRFRDAGKTILLVTHSMDRCRGALRSRNPGRPRQPYRGRKPGRGHRHVQVAPGSGGCRRPLAALAMHVALVLPRFFPYRGGYENSLLALAKYLVAHDHRVTVFTTVADDLESFWLPGFKTFPEEQISVDGVVVRRFPIDYNALRRRATRLLGLAPYWRWKAQYWRPSFRVPGLSEALRRQRCRPHSHRPTPVQQSDVCRVARW